MLVWTPAAACILTDAAHTACLAAATIATGSFYLPVTFHSIGADGEVASVAAIATIGSVSAGQSGVTVVGGGGREAAIIGT
ncbi:hypothetical protein [Nisaea sp.]|uniref:hypothetical protein n=1 Tax=Nisaea sp. TaxID=2024842 RepID=UPI003297F7C9